MIQVVSNLATSFPVVFGGVHPALARLGLQIRCNIASSGVISLSPATLRTTLARHPAGLKAP